MRYDAADARRLGCTGLLGIHWRTKALAGNVKALADAGWDQSWTPADWKTTVEPPPPAKPGPQGGSLANFNAPVADADEQPIYQTVRYNMDAYHLVVPNGTYTVTLKFNEPHYTEKGKRVFGVAIQGKTVIEHLDMFAQYGQNKAHDFTFPDVNVTNGILRIDFQREVEFPCIAGIVVTGPNVTRKINCGGPAYKDYEADLENFALPDTARARSMPVLDFYNDYARASFGANVAEAAGKILASIDGHHLPEPTTWINGPGGLKIDPKPWAEVQPQYAFVGRTGEICGRRSTGPATSQRFDYWLNTYRAMAAMAELGCLRGELDRQMAAITKADQGRSELAEKALSIRVRMARVWERLIGLQVAVTDTPGELGTLANLEQHTRKTNKFLDAHDAALAAALGKPLPDRSDLSHLLQGPARLAVLTVRTQAARDEALSLRIMALDAKPVLDVAVFVRPMGRGEHQRINANHIRGAVYGTTLPGADGDFEYYVEAKTGDGAILRWPATAPKINQTVIVTEPDPA